MEIEVAERGAGWEATAWVPWWSSSIRYRWSLYTEWAGETGWMEWQPDGQQIRFVRVVEET